MTSVAINGIPIDDTATEMAPPVGEAPAPVRDADAPEPEACEPIAVAADHWSHPGRCP